MTFHILVEFLSKWRYRACNQIDMKHMYVPWKWKQQSPNCGGHNSVVAPILNHTQTALTDTQTGPNNTHWGTVATNPGDREHLLCACVVPLATGGGNFTLYGSILFVHFFSIWHGSFHPQPCYTDASRTMD